MGVSVSSEDYSVVAVDLTYEREGVGSFANAFSIQIGDGSVNQFILGEILDVAVEWSQAGLSDLAMQSLDVQLLMARKILLSLRTVATLRSSRWFLQESLTENQTFPTNSSRV